ncbi:MAG: Cro/CI family transcriptional regulator [Rhodospirillaceae bacterium]|jgi:3-hydroxy-9,10-secoandrosta-1,3,5(10)-triene-9,17-dione monooxygenase reductase component
MLAILKSAAQRLGSVNHLAESLGVTRQALYQWSRIPAERVLEIERLTGIARHDLRPDLYPLEQTIDTREFRNALGRFATGITVITTRGFNAKPEGLTVNSFAAVSLEPPQVLWCLGKQSPSLPAFEACSHFAVNVLTRDQRDLSNQFATSSDDKFAGIDWTEGRGGAPILENCLATFECRNAIRHDGGDHLIFIGEVEHFHYINGSPLLFNGGQYGIVMTHPEDRNHKNPIGDFEGLLFWS